MTGLKDMPQEVMEVVIFHCTLSALLQLRLVSRGLKTLVDTSLRFPDALVNIQITLHSSTLERFVETAPPLPFSNFYIKDECDEAHNLPSCFYKDTPQLRSFMELFCCNIRRLRVEHFFCCVSNTEYQFFQCLKNLQDLRIFYLILPSSNYTRFEYSDNAEMKTLRLPCIGTNLAMKRLAVIYEQDSGEYLVEWIRLCPLLVYIRIPRSSGNNIGAALWFLNEQRVEFPRKFEGWSSTCYPYILRLGAEGHLRHLQTLNFNLNDIYMDVCDAEDIRFFQEMVTNQRIRLENVPCEFLDQVGYKFPELSSHLRERVVSFNGIFELFKNEGFSNLEVLSFSSGGIPDDPRVWDVDFRALRLPVLRKISVDIDELLLSRRLRQDFLEAIFRPNEPRTRVTKISIDRVDSLRRFPPQYLDLSFPNLTHLSIGFGDSISRKDVESFVEAISRKSLLQELTLTLHGKSPDVERDDFYPDVQGFTNLIVRSCRWKWRYSMQQYSMKGCGILGLLSAMSLTCLQLKVTDWDDWTYEWIGNLGEGNLRHSILRFRYHLEGEGDPSRSSGRLEMLQEQAHKNRAAKGLASTSFKQFKAFQKTLVGSLDPFMEPQCFDKI